MAPLETETFAERDGGKLVYLRRSSHFPDYVRGFAVGFSGQNAPPLHMSCPAAVKTSMAQEQVILEFIPEWLVKDYVGEVFSPVPLHFSRMFSVPKGDSGRRPIIDLSPLNKLLKKVHFRMEDLWRIARIISKGLWGVKLDLKDAYMSVLLSPLVRRYFGFALGKRTFFFKVLPFGLSTAPWAFTRLMKAIKRFLRKQGLRITSFLNNFLIWASSFQEAVDHTAKAIRLLQRLGFEISWGKSSPAPTRVLEYLGVIIDLENMTFSLPEAKIVRLKSLIKSTERSFFQRSELVTLVGYLSFVADFLPLGRLLQKPIQRWVSQNSSPLLRHQWISLDEEKLSNPGCWRIF